MVNFSLGTFDASTTATVAGALAKLVGPTAAGSADVLVTYTWTDNSANDASDNVGAIGNVSPGWRKMFRVAMDSDDFKNADAGTDISFNTHKTSWLYSNTGSTHKRINLMTDGTCGDPKSSNARSGNGSDSIDKDYIRSMANEVMGLPATGHGTSLTTTANGNVDIFTNEEALLADMQDASTKGIEKQIRTAHDTVLDNAISAETGASGRRDASKNICARIFDQLLGDASGRERLEDRFKLREASSDTISLLDSGDVIYFVITISPKGNVSESVTSDGSADYSPASAPEAGSGADGSDQPGGNNFVESQGPHSISTVSYLCQVTLA